MRIFFFFQAEDGIRDKLVTGVQTCALPISLVERQGASGDRSPFCCRGGRGLRRGAFGREQNEKACERDTRKREPLHTAPENITPVDRRWMAGVYLFS